MHFAPAVCFPIKVIIQILQTWEYGILNFYIRFSCWIPSGFHFPPKPYEQPPPFFATYTYAGFIFNFFERSDPLETVVVFKFLQMTSNLIILFFWLCYLHSNHNGSVRYKGKLFIPVKKIIQIWARKNQLWLLTQLEDDFFMFYVEGIKD